MHYLILVCALMLMLAGTQAQAARVDGSGGGITGWPTVNVTGGVTWANALANAFKVGKDTSNYWALYHDATDGLQFVCVVAGVQNDCNYIRKLASGKYVEWQNSSGISIFRISESGAVTNLTLDSEGSGNNITLPFRWDFDLCAISPADSALSHVWNKDPLSTAPTLTAKAGTNRSTCVATFPDSDGDYGVAVTRRLPTGFTGTLNAEVWWDTTGTGNARFQIATKCYADDEADDAAYNTATVTTAAAGTSGRPNVQSVSAITVTGCAGAELMRIRFFRNRTEASDTLNAALNVEKVYFKGFTTE